MFKPNGTSWKWTATSYQRCTTLFRDAWQPLFRLLEPLAATERQASCDRKSPIFQAGEIIKISNTPWHHFQLGHPYWAFVFPFYLLSRKAINLFLLRQWQSVCAILWKTVISNQLGLQWQIFFMPQKSAAWTTEKKNGQLAAVLQDGTNHGACGSPSLLASF